MAEAFDPYYKWLGIPPQDQPPNYYRLLAINLFESDPDVIEAAADRQMSHLRSYQTGKHSAESQKLLNECAAARLALLNPQKKAECDRQLREKLAILPSSTGESRGEGMPSRPVLRAKPLTQPTAASSPLIDVGASSPAVRLSGNRRKKKPAWLIPASALGGAIALASLMWIVLRPSGRSDLENRQPKTVAAYSRKTAVANSPPERAAAPAKETNLSSPRIAAPAPSASSDSAVAAPMTPGESFSAARVASDSDQRDDGKYLDLTLAPGVTMRLVKISASEDGKIKSFYLGQTEVTQEQWTAVLGHNPSLFAGNDIPVNFVTQQECKAFCDRLNASPAGKRFEFRLPSSEEWLHAFLAGESLDDALKNLGPNGWNASNSDNSAHPIKQFAPNKSELYDMLGNCWEWCAKPHEMIGGAYDQPEKFGLEPTLWGTDDDKAGSVGLRVVADPRN